MSNIQNLLRDGRVDKDATKDIYHLDESKAPDIVQEIKSGDVLLGDGHIYVLIAEDGTKEVVIGNSSDTYTTAFKVSASSDEPITISWNDIEDKPETFAPTIGTTEDTAKAGNWTPSVGDIPNLAISKITGLQTALDGKVTQAQVIAYLQGLDGYAVGAVLTATVDGFEWTTA